MNESNESETEIATTQSRAFTIKDCALLAIATGSRAYNLKELRDILNIIDLASVYYHFWGGLLQPRFEEREYSNDFAAWAWYGLHDATLAERLAMVDPSAFPDLEELRQVLLEIIEDRLDEKEYLFFKHANLRFEFIRSQIVIFDTMKRVESPEDLARLMPTLSPSSIFYHFIDARRRLENQENDFSLWLAGYGDRYQDLCRQLADVDPYFSTLVQVREQLTEIFTVNFAGERGYEKSA